LAADLSVLSAPGDAQPGDGGLGHGPDRLNTKLHQLNWRVGLRKCIEPLVFAVKRHKRAFERFARSVGGGPVYGELESLMFIT
jgi:hypothetical protein